MHVFADRIRERGRYSFANENTDVDVYYCPNLVKKFSISINPSTINLDQNCFVIHLDSGDLIVMLDLVQEVTQHSIPTHNVAPMALIDYLPLMGIRCTEMDRGLYANTTFRSVHGLGCWIQRSILGIDHTTSFNIPVLHIIHKMMARQKNIFLNTVSLQQIIANSQHTCGSKFSLPVLALYVQGFPVRREVLIV